MANYSNLRQAINETITQNGVGAITGPVLNQVLQAMINALGAGYQFVGVANPSTNPGTFDYNVFYLAWQGGTYTNFGGLQLNRGFNILRYDGTWHVDELVQQVNDILPNSLNLPTAGAVFNRFKLDGGAYDVSAHNNDMTFNGLFALLSSQQLSTYIPVDIRHGGMSIKFVRTSDNKYVQYRLMSDTFNTTTANWQGVDSEPTVGSRNLVESGSIAAINENIFSKIDAPKEETFSFASGPINKYFYSGIRYYITNNGENNMSVTPVYEDNTTGSAISINAGVTKLFTTQQTVKRLNTYVANSGAVNVTVKTTNSNQIYEKIEALKTKDEEIDGRTGVYVSYNRSVASGTIGSWSVEKKIKAGTYIVTNAVDSYTSLNFYDAQNNPIYQNSNFPRGVDTEIILSSDAVKMSGYGNNLTVNIRIVGKETILNRVDELEKEVDAFQNIDSYPTKDSTKMMNSGGIYNMANYLFGYRIFQDSQVQTNKYINDSGTIVSGGDRYRLVKFYIPIDITIRIKLKRNDFFQFRKYTSSDYSAEGSVAISAPSGYDRIAELTAGYYAISWYSGSSTTELIADEVVAYTYKNVSSETTKVKNNLDLINGKAAYNIFNKTLGETFERTITPVSNNWSFNENIQAGKYQLTLTPNSSIRFYDAANNEIFYSSGLNGTRNIELSTDVVRVTGYSSNASLSFTLIPLYSHAYRIGILEEQVGDGILFYNPTEAYEPLISSIKYGRVINGSSKKSCISLLHFSDIHGNATNVARLVSFKDKYSSYINDVICTGDIVSDEYQDTNILSGYENMLITLGNHDAWIRTYDEDLAERQEGSSSIWVVKPTYCYNKYFAPNISNWSVTQPADAAADGKCYYYKDYTVGSAKLRLIVLDCMHYNVGSDLVDNVSVQNTWLQGVLADAITNNLPVVIAVHYWPAWIAAGGAIECSYTTTDGYTSDYMPSLLSTTVATFITNGGEFVCYITGHAHADVIATVPNHQDQMFIVVDTANNSNLLGNSLGVGKGQDCFNIISFDVNDKLVKVVRVGRDTCTNLAIKRRLVYRYKQFTDDFGTHNAGLELSE